MYMKEILVSSHSAVLGCLTSPDGWAGANVLEAVVVDGLGEERVATNLLASSLMDLFRGSTHFVL